MAKRLTEAHQVFIVQSLARFKTPTEVVEIVKEEFGLTITKQGVAHYDPTHSQDLAQKWKTLFDTTRAKFIEDVEAIGVAHQAYRLQTLDDLVRIARKQRNYGLVAQLLEQSAKERGGVFTNKRDITSGGASLASVTIYMPNNGRDAATDNQTTAGAAGSVPGESG